MKTLALLILSAAMTFAADITGKWTFTVDLGGQGGSPTFDFVQKGEALTGTYNGAFGSAKLTGTVKGNKVEFSFGSDAGTAKYRDARRRYQDQRDVRLRGGGGQGDVHGRQELSARARKREGVPGQRAGRAEVAIAYELACG